MSFDHPFAAVIFDNDQTLVDSSQAIYDAWYAWAVEEHVTEEQLRGWHGHSTAAIVRELIPAERAEASIARIEQLEIETAGSTVALPGAREAVHACGDRVAVATSGTRPVATARLQAAGIDLPTVFVTASDVEHAKPAPDMFLLAAQRLGVDPADCLVVEDAPAGITAARAAGMSVVGLTTTTPVEQLDADLVVTDLAAVEFRAEADGIHVRVRER